MPFLLLLFKPFQATSMESEEQRIKCKQYNPIEEQKNSEGTTERCLWLLLTLSRTRSPCWSLVQIACNRWGSREYVVWNVDSVWGDHWLWDCFVPLWDPRWMPTLTNPMMRENTFRRNIWHAVEGSDARVNEKSAWPSDNASRIRPTFKNTVVMCGYWKENS